MKKIIILIFVYIISCSDSVTERQKCKEDVLFRDEMVMDPETCIILLSAAAGRNDVAANSGRDLVLVSCLKYNYKMWKCAKKSNILP